MRTLSTRDILLSPKQQALLPWLALLLLGTGLIALYAWRPGWGEWALMGCTAIGAGAVAAFSGYPLLLRLLFILLPLSFELPVGGGTKVALAEPVIGILAIGLLWRWALTQDVSRNFIRHPLTISILLYLVVMAAEAPFSTMPQVSIKYTLVNAVYILVFYYLLHLFFMQKSLSLKQIGWALLPSLLLVAGYTFYIHAGYNFYKEAAPISGQPFFASHALYSAFLAFILPFLAVAFFYPKVFGLGFTTRWAVGGLILIALAAIAIASSRAAWVSVGASLTFYFWLRFRLSFRLFLFFLLAVGLVLYVNQESIYQSLRSNRSDSNSRHATLEEQASSVTSIRNDESNAERLNRWDCALRMWNDRPVAGFGPGTYQFQYLPYQRASEMTNISVENPWNHKEGRGGSAHSEYLLALSEMGILGLVAFILISLAALYTGMQIVATTQIEAVRLLAIAALCGLLSYWVHGFFNNFLNTDKIAFLYWGSLSLLATLSLANSRFKSEKLKEAYRT